MLGSEEKERSVLAIVDLRDRYWATKARAPGCVGLVGDRNPGGIAEERVRIPIGSANMAICAAMIAVGSRLHQRVEHPATGASHFGVVRIGLDFHLLRGFESQHDD